MVSLLNPYLDGFFFLNHDTAIGIVASFLRYG